ncbi:hypothetical protein PR202_ga13842 [Eleusine coracana subsp. coracana]|uniref:Uncharacterized protein n=1 Tax=Eleusine coracana subsp. coracana TaxID=191504 RepID=A0AAV5CFS5_ELECO|nr:hypothetical protein PR202_ga13842 [Eleusine coracana subsp. coracana]
MHFQYNVGKSAARAIPCSTASCPASCSPRPRCSGRSGRYRTPCWPRASRWMQRLSSSSSPRTGKGSVWEAGNCWLYTCLRT